MKNLCSHLVQDARAGTLPWYLSTMKLRSAMASPHEEDSGPLEFLKTKSYDDFHFHKPKWKRPVHAKEAIPQTHNQERVSQNCRSAAAASSPKCPAVSRADLRICWREGWLPRIALPVPSLPLHYSVALAGRFFELFPVNNFYIPASLGDQSRLLQNSSGYGHAGATSS